MQEIKNTLQNIYEKLEQIDEKQAAMAEVQVRHEENLREHMRRTALLEAELSPVRDHVVQVRGATKLVMALVSIISVAAAVYALY